MSSKVSASTRTDVRTDPEPYIREFLRLIDEGWEPDLEEYLNRIPDTLRDQVFQRLDEEMEQRNEASWDELAAEAKVEEEATVAEPEDQPPLLEELIEAEPDPDSAPALSEEVEHALALDAQPPLIQEEVAASPEPTAIQQLFAEAQQAELVSDAQPAPMEEEFELASELQPSWPSLDGYRLERELGSGSLGESYLAWDEASRRQVVLKFPGDSLPEKVIDRTMRDAEKAAMLEEPGVVTFET
ncbi:MAG: hypothetical protein ACYTEG_06325, partial [Planctomycetota bacterium]